jgi:hypothetical protein
MNKNLRILVVMAMLAAFVGMSLSCDSSSTGYKTFSLEKGIGHFSFEYPARYKVEITEVRTDLQYTHVTFSSPFSKELRDSTFITVFVAPPDDASPNSEALLEKSLASAEVLDDFRFVERFSLTVAGVQGQEVVYSYGRLVSNYENVRIPEFMREVYFDRGGLIWSVSMRSNQSMAEADEADFEHVLQTFKILE